jgi:hypothetical protein
VFKPKICHSAAPGGTPVPPLKILHRDGLVIRMHLLPALIEHSFHLGYIIQDYASKSPFGEQSFFPRCAPSFDRGRIQEFNAPLVARFGRCGASRPGRGGPRANSLEHRHYRSHSRNE